MELCTYGHKRPDWFDPEWLCPECVVLAAILVRAMEEIDGPDLLYVGLR